MVPMMPLNSSFPNPGKLIYKSLLMETGYMRLPSRGVGDGMQDTMGKDLE